MFLDDMKTSGERVIWQGKPNRFLYILGNPLIYVVGLLWGAFDLFLMSKFFPIGSGFDGAFPFAFLVPFFLIHLFPLWVAIFGPLVRAISWRNVEYMVTDQRIYLSKGVFGKDVTNLEYHEITHLTVNVNPLENMMHLGSIFLTPDVSRADGNTSFHREGHKIRAIEDPYTLYRTIRELTSQVATDQQFPNAYRPDYNPGYRTKFDIDAEEK